MIKHFAISVLLILFFIHSTYCQNNIPQINDLKFGMSGSHYDTKIPEFKLKEKKRFPEHFPLQLGGEYGYGKRQNIYGTDYGNFWNAYIDIHLFSRTAFLRLEIGGIQFSKRSDGYLQYGALGFNIRIIKDKQHNIYMHGGVSFTRGGVGLIIFSSKYMYSINKYIGLSIGPRFMFTTWEDATYLGILGGFQIFTN